MKIVISVGWEDPGSISGYAVDVSVGALIRVGIDVSAGFCVPEEVMVANGCGGCVLIPGAA